jgi:arsenate reductase-like glutaredoxin family protein
MTVQIFGVKGSQATRAAERFFKERRVAIQLIDLQKKSMSPGEIKRFIDRFTLAALVDRENPSIKYLRLSDTDLLAKIERDPKLLHLPLVRAANRLSIGHDEESWKSMLA